MDDSGLKDASGYLFYNTSRWTLKKLYTNIWQANNKEKAERYFDDFITVYGTKYPKATEYLVTEYRLVHLNLHTN